jgi:PAS domain S-box-containing protein
VKILQADARFQQVRRLTEVSRALTCAVSSDEVLELAVRETTSLLRTERVALLLREGDSLSVRSPPLFRKKIDEAVGGGPDALDEEAIERVQGILGQDGRYGFLAVPLVIANEVAGVLTAALAPGPELVVEDFEWLLSAIADQAAVALEKLRLSATTAQAERARREREEQFQSLYHSPLIGLVFRNHDGEIVDANDAFLRLSGYSREEVGSRSMQWDALGIRAPSPTRPDGLPERRVRPFESELVRKGGQGVEVVVGVAELEYQQCDLVFVMDISAQKRAEASVRMLSEISKALLGASLDVDALFKSIAWLAVPRFADWCAVESVEDGTILDEHVAIEHLSSSRVERVLEWRRRFPPDTRSTMGVAEVIRSGQSQLHQEIPETFLAEYACESDRVSELQKAGLRSAILVPMIIHGKVVGAITFVRAATRSRYGAQDLLLAEEIAGRAASAVEKARLYRRAQEAIGVRDDFLSVAAHELKTPLTTLQLHLGSLQRSGETDRDKILRRISSATRQTDRLGHLVADLLDVSRIAAGRVTLNRETCDLAELAREVVSQFETEALNAGSEIRTDFPQAPVVGRWDRVRIEQVIVNLLSNALKYGSGKPVALSVSADDGVARIVVKDQGIGISEQDISRIFGRFERAVSTRNYGGLGLGLFIAREIVQAHRGEIRVVSNPGSGAEFTVRLPTAAAEKSTGALP